MAKKAERRTDVNSTAWIGRKERRARPMTEKAMVAEAIVAGYRRTPQTDDEVAAARFAGLWAIAAEPW